MTPAALELRYDILASVRRLGTATACEIAEALSEERQIPTKSANLSRTLRQMVRAQLLRNAGRGVYALSANYSGGGRYRAPSPRSPDR